MDSRMTRLTMIIATLLCCANAAGSELPACRPAASAELIQQLDRKLAELNRQAQDTVSTLGRAMGELKRCKQNPHPRIRGPANQFAAAADQKIAALNTAVDQMLPTAAKVKEGATDLDFTACANEVDKKAKKEEIMKVIIRVRDAYEKQKRECPASPS